MLLILLQKGTYIMENKLLVIKFTREEKEDITNYIFSLSNKFKHKITYRDIFICGIQYLIEIANSENEEHWKWLIKTELRKK